MKQWIVLGITLSCFGLLSACQESSPGANNEEAATARDLPVLSFDQAATEDASNAEEPVAAARTAVEDNILATATRTAAPEQGVRVKVSDFVEAERVNVSATYNASYHHQETIADFSSTTSAHKDPSPAKDSDDDDDN